MTKLQKRIVKNNPSIYWVIPSSGGGLTLITENYVRLIVYADGMIISWKDKASYGNVIKEDDVPKLIKRHTKLGNFK